MLNFWNKIINIFKFRKDLINNMDEIKQKPKKPLLRILSKYDMIKVFETEKDLIMGLLKYKNIPYNMAFLFRFKNEELRLFHTIGMKFNIDIYFFNKKGNLIAKYIDCPPGKNYSSLEKCKYVVEVKSDLNED
jgi:uncharacterized membrane protein (UPF0127 family)